jgi:hypothetical protein
MYTIAELSVLFGKSRQAIRQQVEKMDSSFKAKNLKNHLVINEMGVRQLEQHYLVYVLSENEDNIDIPRENWLSEIKEQINFERARFVEVVNQNKKEKEFFQEQLKLKDEQLFLLHEKLELALKDNQRILENQINDNLKKKSIWKKIFDK